MTASIIERLWKHVKGRLRTKYYDAFENFKSMIDSTIDDTGKGSKALIEKLIGESVQIFDTPVPINGNSFVSIEPEKPERKILSAVA